MLLHGLNLMAVARYRCESEENGTGATVVWFWHVGVGPLCQKMVAATGVASTKGIVCDRQPLSNVDSLAGSQVRVLQVAVDYCSRHAPVAGKAPVVGGLFVCD